VATIISGAAGTFDVLAQRLVVDMSPKIYLLEPDSAPLTVLLNKLTKEKAENPKYEWMEDELMPNWTNITNNAGTGTTINLGASAGATGHAKYVTKYSLIKVPSTGEVMLVTAVNESTGAITVTRGYGTDVSSVDGSSTPVPVVIIGTAFAEGAAGSELTHHTTKQTGNYNYIQIFREPVKVTRTAALTNMYGGKLRVTEQAKKGIEILRNIENAFLYGVRYLDTSGERRTTGGALYFISTNSTNIGGSLTYTQLENFLRSVFRYGRQRKFLIASPLVMSAISIIAEARGSVRLVPKATSYGVSIRQWSSPHGDVMLLKNVNLTGSTYGGYGICLELEECAFRYMQDVVLETNVQNPADLYYLDVYTAMVGFELHNEQKHGVMYGISGGSGS